MLALHELQAEFGRALLGPGNLSAALLDSLSTGPYAKERFAIYRNNVHASLAAILRDTFPVICRLTGERFFAYAAHEFVRAYPPTRPALYEYGAAFADFIERFPPCRELVYLPDVARLEWLMNVVATARDECPLSSCALAGFAPEAAAYLQFRLRTLYLESPWPLDRIWRANQTEAADEVISLNEGGARLEVSRRDGIAGFRSLNAADFAFRSALADGAILGAAIERALGVDASFVAGEALTRFFHDGAVVAVSHASSDKQPAS
jgi:hypothetical protein